MTRTLTLLLILMTLGACSLPGNPTPLPVTPSLVPVTPTFTPGVTLPTSTSAVPTFTAIPASTPTNVVPSFCNDPQISDLLASFKTAVTTSDGALLALLVSPSRGMDVRAFHTGNVINYDQEHAKFVFETTYQAPWGSHPASGEEVTGAFHEIIVPELLKVFGRPFTLHCNEIKTGGVSYQPLWPYQGQSYYSAYFAGTEANGYLDWHTWVIGIETVSGKPYIFALLPFFWEP